MPEKFELQVENKEKKDYVTKYKDLEIKEVGKGGDTIAKELKDEYLVDVEDIVFSTVKDGKVKRVSLKERFLPHGYRFAFSKLGEEFEFKPEERILFEKHLFKCYHSEKVIIYANLSNLGNQINLFHEIGRAINNIKYNGIDEKTARRGGRLSSLEHKLNTGGGFDPKKEELEKEKELLKDCSLIERRAWAYAEKKFKELRAEGIKLEPEIKMSKELKEVISYSLKSGDRTYMSLIKLIFGKPIFWKGKKPEWLEEFERGAEVEL